MRAEQSEYQLNGWCAATSFGVWTLKRPIPVCIQHLWEAASTSPSPPPAPQPQRHGPTSNRNDDFGPWANTQPSGHSSNTLSWAKSYGQPETWWRGKKGNDRMGKDNLFSLPTCQERQPGQWPLTFSQETRIPVCHQMLMLLRFELALHYLQVKKQVMQHMTSMYVNNVS